MLLSAKRNDKGFTIVELMVATLVFSVILLLCATALIQLVRIYQKGVIRSQTQEVTRSASVSISELIQFNGGSVSSSLPTVNGSQGYCIGNKRISFRPNRKLVSGAPAANETNAALVIDSLPGCSATTPAQDLSTSSVVGDELLATNMRIRGLTITTAAANLHNITLDVAYGDDDLFDGAGNCIAARFGGAFCATSSLSTTVKKRIVR